MDLETCWTAGGKELYCCSPLKPLAPLGPTGPWGPRSPLSPSSPFCPVDQVIARTRLWQDHHC